MANGQYLGYVTVCVVLFLFFLSFFPPHRFSPGSWQVTVHLTRLFGGCEVCVCVCACFFLCVV